MGLENFYNRGKATAKRAVALGSLLLAGCGAGNTGLSTKLDPTDLEGESAAVLQANAQLDYAEDALNSADCNSEAVVNLRRECCEATSRAIHNGLMALAYGVLKESDQIVNALIKGHEIVPPSDKHRTVTDTSLRRIDVLAAAQQKQCPIKEPYSVDSFLHPGFE